MFSLSLWHDMVRNLARLFYCLRNKAKGKVECVYDNTMFELVAL